MNRRALTPDEKAWANNLKRIWLAKKKTLDLTQEKAAEALGWRSQGAVGQYLNGVIPLNTDAKLKFARLLGVGVQEIDPEFNSHLAATPKLESQDIEPGPRIQGRVPLISWVRAGEFCEAVDLFEPGDAEEWIPCPVNHSDSTYALRVRGASMEPRFHEGEIIIVDPLVSPDPGRFIIAKKTDSNEATIKQLVVEGDESYLRALNPDWPERYIQVTEEWNICGVVICKLEML